MQRNGFKSIMIMMMIIIIIIIIMFCALLITWEVLAPNFGPDIRLSGFRFSFLATYADVGTMGPSLNTS